jgi:hypothetical protein
LNTAYTMKKLLLLLFTSFAAISTDAQLSINEFLASNSITNSDNNGDFDDWIEIYNAGSTPVDLGGYYITDDPLDLQKFQIPAGSSSITTVPANGFILIWCDEEGTQGPMHANFKLSATGEFIGLSDPNQILLDSLTFGAQTPDISQGLATDGGTTWMAFSSPTPAATNVTVGLLPQSLSSNFCLYPSPATDRIASTDGQSFSVLSLTGQSVTFSNSQGVADVSRLPAGIYIAYTPAGTTTRFTKR